MSPSAVEMADGPVLDENLNIFNKKGSDMQSMAVGAVKKDGTSAVPTMPVFESKEAEQKYCKEHMACAFRVFAANGFDEGLAGHMSLRDPINPKTFWINPYAMHFEDICVSDLVQVTEEAQVIAGEHSINAAGFAIHSEIHKAHPWINAVCHAHSVAGKAYSVFGKKLPPLMQDSLRFYDTHEVLHDYGGPALSTDEGKAIAGVVKENTKVAILQNHGLLSVGTTIDEAAYYFCAFDRCCKSQLMIEAAAPFNGGIPREIDHETAVFTEKRTGTRYRGWLHFQPYYTNMLKKTKGEFLN